MFRDGAAQHYRFNRDRETIEVTDLAIAFQVPAETLSRFLADLSARMRAMRGAALPYFANRTFAAVRELVGREPRTIFSHSGVTSAVSAGNMTSNLFDVQNSYIKF